MVNKISLLVVLFVSAVFLVNIPGVCLAQPADNTGINKRDTTDEKMTADQQSQTKEDREITQKIRQSVVDDESLSTYAHNVKIITVGGMVTLKGPVRSEDEKRIIEEKAAQIAGEEKITSEIEIAP
ncbi:MAG: BON domain-containing protein [Deltaproteobacteria bacterium]|nr:BON domain-containing protein [Deltaproteobacteria bacterium]TLN04942.1 MAG: BON domain-containing protein [bacterium]